MVATVALAASVALLREGMSGWRAHWQSIPSGHGRRKVVSRQEWMQRGLGVVAVFCLEAQGHTTQAAHMSAEAKAATPQLQVLGSGSTAVVAEQAKDLLAQLVAARLVAARREMARLLIA